MAKVIPGAPSVPRNFMVNLLKVTVVVFMVVGFRLWVASKPLSTEQKMLRTCGLTQYKGKTYFNSNDHRLQFGWDASHRFYAVEGKAEAGIVDSQNGQCCVLGTSGGFFAGAFTNDAYRIRYYNQYGWSTTTSLDLQRWEVSTSVSGACSKGAGCQRIDPPEIAVLGHCDPAHIYDPAGLN